MIRLEDARGCWKLFDPCMVCKVRGHENTVRPRGAQWKTARFKFLGRLFDIDIYRSELPAIGPKGPFMPHLHLPEGWHAPAEKS